MKSLLLSLLLLFAVSCSTVDQNQAPEPTQPTVTTPADDAIEVTIKPRWETLKGITSYTALAHKYLKSDGKYLLTGELKDLRGMCGDCVNMDRIQVMTYLLSLMVEKESYFRPALEYKESFNDSRGRRVVSTGLFQISIESSNGSRYKCGINSQSELKDPAINMRCSIRILNALAKENKRIQGRVGGRWQGGSRYWSVLRSSRASAYNHIMAKMKAIK